MLVFVLREALPARLCLDFLGLFLRSLRSFAAISALPFLCFWCLFAAIPSVVLPLEPATSQNFCPGKAFETPLARFPVRLQCLRDI